MMLIVMVMLVLLVVFRMLMALRVVLTTGDIGSTSGVNGAGIVCSGVVVLRVLVV